MRILIIDDEKDISGFLKKHISAEYFSVDIADNGETGSFLARTNEYDLIILDNGLPIKSGLEVLKEIRGSEKTMPILVLSAEQNPLIKIELLNSGADDYLTKPFAFGELLARMKALLRRSKQSASPQLILDDLILDSNTHVVSRESREIYLTRKEFMLLEYLLQNKYNVISRRMILEHVWNTETDPFSNTIESHIKSLRKKVDPDNKKKLIYTIPGVGYKICA